MKTLTTAQIAKMTMVEIVSFYNKATGKTTKNPFKSKPFAIETMTRLGMIDDEKTDKRCTWSREFERSQKDEVKPLRKVSLKGQLASLADGSRTISELADMFDWSIKHVKYQLRSLNRNKGYGYQVFTDQTVHVFPAPIFS